MKTHNNRNNKSNKKTKGYSRRKFMRNTGGAVLGGGLLSAFGFPFSSQAAPVAGKTQANTPDLSSLPLADRIAADPTDIPGPINRNTPKTHQIELTTKEMTAEIEDGIKFHYMTFGGKVPGPLIRVRQGDTVELTLTSDQNNVMLHNIDLHAVYGTGGGANDTYVTPGSSETIEFKAMYPGAFIYHCAVPRLDYHISSGMYGMIVVEPKEGLPEVDHEFYFGQNEVYLDGDPGQKGIREFNFDAMKDENPAYVLLNGEKNAITGEGRGPVKVKKGETARVFLVNGGPNLTSSFHPIGNVFTKAWREGAVMSNPERYVQTMPVAPGSCGVFEMEFPVPETIHLVDHALSRVAHKGMKGNIVVEGEPEKGIYNAKS